MTTSWVKKLRTLPLFLLAVSCMLFLHGAVPFIAMPTLGQAVAMMGFPQSFANDSTLAVYSTYFGYPTEASLTMGMPIAFPAGFLIRAGMHASDAYSALVAAWLALAFFGAYCYARLLEGNRFLSILAAFLWMSMPFTWAHSDYSSLSVGISLLPFYLFSATKIFVYPSFELSSNFKWCLVYVVLCSISVFMDGYSFMMFAVGSSLLFGYAFIYSREMRLYLIKLAAPVHVLGFGLAYFLYVTYIGKSQYDPSSLDFFRGWGVDLTFLVIPTQGIHWFWDALGLSVTRSENQYFGDASVWNTTFSLPLILVGLVSFWLVRYKKLLASTFVLLALFGFYMSMGPSIKINSIKPYPMEHQAMPAKMAVAPSGNAIIYQQVPGFKNMRASYRWSVLGAFGLWALLVLYTGEKKSAREQLIWGSLFIGLIAMNVPNLKKKWAEYLNHRESFIQIDRDLVTPLSADLSRNERVAFLPFRNDFMINYLAPKLGVRTYNIGGDKQLDAARQHWPETMRGFPMAIVDRDFADRILLLLAKNEVDVVVLPYVDMLWAAHQWPSPVQFKDELGPSMVQLHSSGFVDFGYRNFYATVRLKPEFSYLTQQKISESTIRRKLCLPPNCLKRVDFFSSTPSLVGIAQNNRLKSSGRTGLLHFGPYVPMEAGHYKLLVRGKGNITLSAWVDVVSGKGTIEYGKFALQPTAHDGGVLAEGQIQLDAPVEDIEIRVYVGAEDDVTLEGYELVPMETEDHSASLEHNPLN